MAIYRISGGVAATPARARTAAAAAGEAALAFPEAAPAAPVDARPTRADAHAQALALAETQPAMRPDQLTMAHQFQYRAPDAATLGAAWRVMVRAASVLAAALQDQGRGHHLPGSLFMAAPAARGRHGEAAEQAPWRFPVYGWVQQRMMLSVVERDDGRAPSEPRDRQSSALRLDLILPELGHVAVQMVPGAHGILLELAAVHEAGRRHLRALLPQMVAVIDQAGLRIVRCRLVRSLGGARAAVPLPSQAAALPFALYKAMAGVALLLSTPPPPHADSGPHWCPVLQLPMPA
jgi:hypothetical protein